MRRCLSCDLHTPLLFLVPRRWSLVVVIVVLVVGGCAGGEEVVISGRSSGKWDVLLANAGVSAMHMQLLPSNKVVIFDRTDFGPSRISLPGGSCRNDPHDLALPVDCFAHSVEYDVLANSVRPLTLLTDTWCSSGGLDSNATLVQSGGYNDGSRTVRYFPGLTSSGADWTESPSRLTVGRWYASNQFLPDKRFIVVGGRRQFNYEFIPSPSSSSYYSQTTHSLPFLYDTCDGFENNLYPFLHLCPDGNLFIFANADSILLDYKAGVVVRRFPRMPGGEAHNYPSSGSSVLLPLDARDGFRIADVLVCGGASPKSIREASVGNFLDASSYCGRLRVTSKNDHVHNQESSGRDPSIFGHDPVWEMEEMPYPRVMGDMVLLPSGDVLIINGAQKGTAGWGIARDPAFWPVLYRPYAHLDDRFQVLSPSTTPRLYHSTAILLPSGSILVGGGNPHVNYNFTDLEFPTQISLESFQPPYLNPSYDEFRPHIVVISQATIKYGNTFSLDFRVEVLLDTNNYSFIEIMLICTPFTTHSFSMNQRLLKLHISQFETLSQDSTYRAHVSAPPLATLAPPGYYLIFIAQDRIPSFGSWIKLID